MSDQEHKVASPVKQQDTPPAEPKKEEAAQRDTSLDRHVVANDTAAATSNTK